MLFVEEHCWSGIHCSRDQHSRNTTSPARSYRRGAHVTSCWSVARPRRGALFSCVSATRSTNGLGRSSTSRQRASSKVSHPVVHLWIGALGNECRCLFLLPVLFYTPRIHTIVCTCFIYFSVRAVQCWHLNSHTHVGTVPPVIWCSCSRLRLLQERRHVNHSPKLPHKCLVPSDQTCHVSSDQKSSVPSRPIRNGSRDFAQGPPRRRRSVRTARPGWCGRAVKRKGRTPRRPTPNGWCRGGAGRGVIEPDTPR